MLKRIKESFVMVFTRPMPMEDYGDYDGYWKARSETPLLNRYRFIADKLPENASLLDIGCGDGRFLRYVRDVRPGVRLFGVDRSEVAISRVRESGISGDVVDAAGDLPPIGKLDVVTIMELIEHLAEPERLMQQLHSMQPGTVYITVPNLGFILHRLRLALGGQMPITAIQFHIKEHLRFWTVADFKYWAGRLGFKVMRCYAQSPKWLARRMPSLFSSQVIYELRTISTPSA